MHDHYRNYPTMSEEWSTEIMTAIDDLNAAVTAVGLEQVAVMTAVEDLLAETANLQLAASQGNSAAIETAVGKINTIAASLKGSAASDPGPQQAYDPATSLPLYVYSGTDPVSSEWTAVTDVTGTAGATLYTFSGDSSAASPTGTTAGVWTPYTGPLTTTAPSATA
jgi:hypothetical protein